MPPYTSNTQVDNAGIDVRLDPAPQPPGRHAAPAQSHDVRPRAGRSPAGRPTATIISSSAPGPAPGAGNPISCPTASRIPAMSSISTNPPRVQRTTPAVPGRWGEAPSIPGVAGLRRGRPGPELGGEPLQQPGPGGLLLRHRRPAQRGAPRRRRRQLQPVRPLSDRSHRRGQRPRLLRLRRWSDAARRPDAPVRHAGRHRRIGPGAALGRPLARGRRRGRRLRPGRLRRLFPPPRRPGVISVDPGNGATPGAIVYPSANNDLFYTAAPTRPI